MKNSLIISTLFLLVSCGNKSEKNISNAASNENNESSMNGEQLYKINCIQCHLPHKDFIGPAIAGVEDRWPDKKLLYEYVRNSQDVIKKDKYAADLFEKWKKTPMMPFPQLSDADIDAIFSYCNDMATTK